MKLVFSRPKALSDVTMAYCQGCTHGIAHRLVAEVIDELGILERTIGICPVGCSVFLYQYMECDMIEASHGRAPAVATGVKRVLPDRVVFTYQGDGDLAAIGTAEIIHAAARGENITVVFINNTTYGMTGGQMAPTTMPGQETTTTPGGRDPAKAGNPIKVCELLSPIEGTAYIARASLTSPANVMKAKKAIKTAFQMQLEGKGFSLVELLSSCPTQFGMSPLAALKHVDEVMTPYYPLGEFKRIS
ncbi:MAG: thiamine pyrophosphate-dependent enzyme [Armatimonadota bacterium]|nr:thiamine pyrophosphate-dependent enzyme [Armatimonadota bacterium]